MSNIQCDFYLEIIEMENPETLKRGSLNIELAGLLMVLTLIVCSIPLLIMQQTAYAEEMKPLSVQELSEVIVHTDTVHVEALQSPLYTQLLQRIIVVEVLTDSRTSGNAVQNQTYEGIVEIQGSDNNSVNSERSSDINTRIDNVVVDSVPGHEKVSYVYDIRSDEEYELLCKVVEAEVTGESYKYNGSDVSREDMLNAKIAVAQVYLNRVYNTDDFGSITTISEALLQKNASSTIGNGRYNKVQVTDFTREAVDKALLSTTVDYSKGALYFSSGTTECKYGDYMFTDAVGHSFFK